MSEDHDNTAHNMTINDFPNELLCEILSHILCQDYIEIGKTNDDSIWLLREVCSRWTALIQNTPSFWCRFRITNKIEVDGMTSANRIQLCLRYSKSELLSVGLYNWIWPFYSAYQFLLDNGHRISSLGISKLLARRMPLSSIHLIRLCQLRSFSTDAECSQDASGGAVAFPFQLLSHTSGLEEMNLKHIMLWGILSEGILWSHRWENMRKLSLHSNLGTTSNYMTILSGIPNLEDLSFTNNRAISSHDKPVKSTILPHLRKLTVYNTTTRLSKDIWPLMVVPKLSHLTVGFHEDPADDTLILNMIRASGSTISRLTFLSCKPIAQYISAIPGVQELCLPEDKLSPELQNLLHEYSLKIQRG